MNKIFSIHPSIVPIMPLYLLAVIFFILAFSGFIFPTLFSSIFPDSFAFLSQMFFIGIGLVIAVSVAIGTIENKFTTYVLTSEDFRIQTGIISKTEIVIPLIKIQDITLSCSAMQSMLNIGIIIMDTADERIEGSTELVNIDNPEKYKKQILDAIEIINKNNQSKSQT
jgi:uncharacterized membrane protein YdbT with pleckstrin-like domain